MKARHHCSKVAGFVASVWLAAGCGREPVQAATCPAPRLVPAPFTVGDGTLDRGFPGGVSLADVDGDGDLDLMATRGYSPTARPLRYDRSLLYLNDGAGNFTRDTASALSNAENPASGSTWGDVDQDGDLDAFVNTQHNRTDVFYHNLGGGRFARQELGDATQTRGSNFSSSWVDIDVDGDLDLFVGGPTLERGQPNLVYRNDGGSFVRVADSPIAGDSANAGAVLWADVDNDGDPDLFVAYSDILRRNNLAPARTETSQLWRNDGNWTFVRTTGQAFSDSVYSAIMAALGDTDNDGDLDLFLGHFGGRDAMFLNDGQGRFTRDDRFDGHTHPQESTSATLADFDLDGDLDLVATYYNEGIRLWQNDGAGGFSLVQDSALLGRAAHYWSAASGDIDADGDVDLLIGNWGMTDQGDFITRLRNESERCGQPLRVRLRDRHGTPDPIGARVILITRGRGGERRQLRESMGQTTFRGQSGDAFLFGVPTGERAVRVEIRWPTGETQRIKRLALDRVNEIRQDR
jgi:hypothetical protein